jgi:hypothetical protein
MTGPEHYREAERLLAESRTELRPHEEGHCEADRTIAEAQVHATLAAVAIAVEQTATKQVDRNGATSLAIEEWAAVVAGQGEGSAS